METRSDTSPHTVRPPRGTIVTAVTHLGRDGGYVRWGNLIIWAATEADGEVTPDQRVMVLGDGAAGLVVETEPTAQTRPTIEERPHDE